jgi:hypothetical protein
MPTWRTGSWKPVYGRGPPVPSRGARPIPSYLFFLDLRKGRSARAGARRAGHAPMGVGVGEGAGVPDGVGVAGGVVGGRGVVSGGGTVVGGLVSVVGAGVTAVVRGVAMVVAGWTVVAGAEDPMPKL